jgi:(p)ppGpp synthase/HD superfamily hydrolase
MTVMKVLDGKEFNMEERFQLLEQVGNFSITPASLLKRILKAQNIKYESTRKNLSSAPKQSNIDPEEELKEIIIGGEKNIAYKTCKTCCKNGVPDQIVAHINSRGQFTIHSRDCSVLQ